MDRDVLLSYLKDISQLDDEDAFRKLYEHYYNRLFRQALYYLNNNRKYAQEIISDVFIVLWQGRKVLDRIKDPDAYLFIALKHASSRFIASHYKKDIELLTDNLPELHSDNNRADIDLTDKELQEEYRIAVNNLPPRCAEVFCLVREERKKYSEVAEMLGISVKTVDNQMNKAVKLLYGQLKGNLVALFF